jgi:hypothetical protein
MVCALLLAVLAQVPAPPPPPPPAALKATIRLSVAKVDTPAPPIGDKATAYGNFGPLISQLLTPEGPVDIGKRRFAC